MWNFLAPPAHKQELPAEKIDSAYKSYRWPIVSKIIFRSKNIVRPISQLVEKQMNYS